MKINKNTLHIEEFITDGNNIIKINTSDAYNHYGFDILTECYIKLDKSKCYKVPNIVFDLIKSEENRIKVVYHIAGKASLEYKSKLLGISDRTFYRGISKLGLNCL